MTLGQLFQKYIGDQLTADELRKFREMSARPENRAELDRLLAGWMEKEIDGGGVGAMGVHGVPGAKVESAEVGEIRAAGSRSAVVPMRRRYWIAAAVAACLAVATGVFVFREHRGEGIRPGIAVVKPQVIVPAGNKAILTLGDGRQVVLDSLSDGKVAVQGATVILKDGGKLNYEAAGAGVAGESAAPAVQYNQISTPRGGYYELVLPDGSRVWLDAASSLRFPVAFGGDRTVELTGEAYFEVAGNAGKPFFVRSQGVTVQVLGTELNMMAYGDEDAVRTTLVSGAVKVMSGDGSGGAGGVSQVIRPGEQASWGRGGQEWKISKPDMRQVLAWKQGEFRFEGLPIAAIMRQIGRWYDVDVEFKGVQPVTEFNGVIPRARSVNELLAVLEETEEVHFTIQGRKIIVEAGGRPPPK